MRCCLTCLPAHLLIHNMLNRRLKRLKVTAAAKHKQGHWQPMKASKALEARPPLSDNSFVMRWPMTKNDSEKSRQVARVLPHVVTCLFCHKTQPKTRQAPRHPTSTFEGTVSELAAWLRGQLSEEWSHGVVLGGCGSVIATFDHHILHRTGR